MTDIYVIDNLQTTIDVIIGTDVLKQTEFKIGANGIELIPKKKDPFINLVNVYKAHNESELKDNAQEVLQLKLKNAEDKCKNLEMHVQKILIVNALTESDEHPKTSISTKEREIKPSKHKTKKLKSSGRNANKTSDSDENQALDKEINYLLRQIDFLNSIILNTKLKEPNKSKAQFVKKRKQLHIYKKDEPVTIKRTQFGTELKLRPKVGQHESLHLTSKAIDFTKKWSTADA
ncbi:hypothetical protein TNCV_4956131 [Trichonephila clavipes]|nr:hypothetical protein TNCV_4956131 [Trichonephila clavipes]